MTEVLKTKLNWLGDMAFNVETEGHSFVVDAAAESGGQNKGPKPKVLLLTSLGGCVGMTLKMVLSKMNINCDNLKIVVEGDMSKEHPIIYDNIRVYLKAYGVVDEEKFKQAYQIAEKNLCPVHAMLTKASDIKTCFEFAHSQECKCGCNKEEKDFDPKSTHRVVLNWKDDLTFESITDNHELMTDLSAEYGSKDLGPSPRGLLLAALGGCTSMDITYILKKMRQNLEKLYLEIEGEIAADNPKVITKINVNIHAFGDLKEEKVAEASSMSENKYCGVNAMVRKASEVKYNLFVNS
ncbi:MAG: OsmC family protein [Candidatus Coatesbacteria bacterium]|nr:OsmC family protein [Candidatus Coatesbacteria bacterium]